MSLRRLLEVRLMTDAKIHISAIDNTVKRHSQLVKELNTLLKDESTFRSESGNEMLIEIANNLGISLSD